MKPPLCGNSFFSLSFLQRPAGLFSFLSLFTFFSLHGMHIPLFFFSSLPVLPFKTFSFSVD
jgi:hypothetical protein